jgi:glycerophosphoryl diester phosphodiesterase
MNDYKAKSERTDENERLLIPPFKKTPAKVKYYNASIYFTLKHPHEHLVESKIEEQIDQLLSALLTASDTHVELVDEVEFKSDELQD